MRCDDSVTDGNESDNEASDNDDDDVTPKNLTVHEGNDVVDESEKVNFLLLSAAIFSILCDWYSCQGVF